MLFSSMTNQVTQISAHPVYSLTWPK